MTFEKILSWALKNYISWNLKKKITKYFKKFPQCARRVLCN